MKTIDDVRSFWNSNPLWSGESTYPIGSREYFEEHESVVISDCFAGHFDNRTMPDESHLDYVLDLGCGPGFWTVKLIKHRVKKVHASDLTESAVTLTKKRCQLFDFDQVEYSIQNAESMTFTDNTFDHVNCQGVVHHTPNTEVAIHEIARVLKNGGTACISVYFKNFLLRNWNHLTWIGKILSNMGAKLTGRGRESIFREPDINEIVRQYDGAENPIGKAYSRSEFLKILNPYFKIENVYFHFFPARALPFSLLKSAHKLLDRYCGFMIYVNLKKR